MEFPACEACNHGTRDDDLLVAMLGRMDPRGEAGNRDGKLVGLMKRVRTRHPGIFESMVLSPVEARRRNREHGIKPGIGKTYQDAGVVRVPPAAKEAVRTFASKLAKGVFYNDTRSVFPNDGCLLLGWSTNTALVRTGEYPVFAALKHLAGTTPKLVRSGRSLDDQFDYKLSLADGNEYLILQARVGGAFGLVVYGSPIADRLEAHVRNLVAEKGEPNPFIVLQSTSL